MYTRVTRELQPELQDLLRSLDLEYQYAYTSLDSHGNIHSLSILVECAAISLDDLESLLPWGSFIVSPHNDVTLELFTSLPDDIEKCII